jgi:hypothetical protein
MTHRARRRAQLRTRLDTAAVMAGVREIVETPAPEGMTGFFARGYVTGGSVGKDEFFFDYHFNSQRNPQTYEVRGKVDDVQDWRVVRIDVKAHDPWLGWWAFLVMAAYGVFVVLSDDVPVGAAAALVGFVLAVYGFANLVYVPDTVTDRVTRQLAARLRASVFSRGDWVVPLAPD